MYFGLLLGLSWPAWAGPASGTAGAGTTSFRADAWEERATDGTWSRHAMGYPVVLNFRGKLAPARSGNLYAVLPDLRIAAAAPPEFATWTLLSSSDAGRFFSDPLLDTARLLAADTLTVIYPVKNSPDILVLDHAVE